MWLDKNSICSLGMQQIRLLLCGRKGAILGYIHIHVFEHQFRLYAHMERSIGRINSTVHLGGFAQPTVLLFSGSQVKSLACMGVHVYHYLTEIVRSAPLVNC